MIRLGKDFSFNLCKELKGYFEKFYRNRVNCEDVVVRCVYLKVDDDPEAEVTVYKYKFQIVLDDKLYVYPGWCYEGNLEEIPLGIFSHWLVTNYKVYQGPCTTLYDMYTGDGNLTKI